MKNMALRRKQRETSATRTVQEVPVSRRKERAGLHHQPVALFLIVTAHHVSNILKTFIQGAEGMVW